MNKFGFIKFRSESDCKSTVSVLFFLFISAFRLRIRSAPNMLFYLGVILWLAHLKCVRLVCRSRKHTKTHKIRQTIWKQNYVINALHTSDSRHSTYLPRISNSSPTPLKCSVSYIKRKNILFICLRIKARSPKNFP